MNNLINVEIGVEMSVIGLKGCGKTTYLVSLLSLEEVSSTGMSKDKLLDLLENCLKQRLPLPATEIGEFVYRFDIALDRKKEKRWKKPMKIKLSIKDNAGEYMEMINVINSQTNHSAAERQNYRKTVDSFFEELKKVNRWMIMVSDLRVDADETLCRVLHETSKCVNENSNLDAIKSLRIAVVMSKCERGELWSGRIDPESDLFKIRLPETYKFIKHNLSVPMEFFACSAMGVLGSRDPRPNRIYVGDESKSLEYRARLRDTNQWKPYGVLEPIYWLSTGEKLHNEFI
jgi:GTPase SAR1 family protein